MTVASADKGDGASAGNGGALIGIRGVSKTYALADGSSVGALNQLDLEVFRKDFLVVTGRSGCGKTTMLNVAAGLARPSIGTVLLDGTDMWGLSDDERSRLRRERMGFVFQFPSLMPSLNVLQNVVLPFEFGPGVPANGLNRGRELLQMVGLGERLTSYPRELSAGQQQRVVIARSLVYHPELLLADEPSSNLDEETEAEIMALLRTIHGERGVTIVMVTHTKQLVTHGTRHVEMASGAMRDRA